MNTIISNLERNGFKKTNMKRNLKEEPLPKLNKGSAPANAPVNVKSKQLEKIRYVAQSMTTLRQELSKLETDSESSAGATIATIEKMLKNIQVKFLKEYVTLYK